MVQHDTSIAVIISRVEEAVYDDRARSVIAPGTEGVLTILPKHEAFITTLGTGAIYVTDLNGETHHIPVAGGLLECSDEQVSILI